MDLEERIRSVRESLRFRGPLLDDGASEHDLRAALRDRRHVRVAAGVYAVAEDWAAWRREERLLALVIATDRISRSRRPLFCRFSAAAIWGLPLYDVAPGRADVLAEGARPGPSTAAVRRHAETADGNEIVEIGGLRCTGLERTLLDAARFGTAEQAIPCLDAGIRHSLGADVGAQRERAERVVARLADMPGRRGVARARRLLRFADGRAESVAESLSRLQLRRLGYAVEIQVGVEAPNGGMYRVDFELLGLGVFCEVDGMGKYTDPVLRRGRSVERVVLEEKAREDWIRGRTAKRFIRWGFAESRTAAALAAHLRARRVPPPPPR